MSGCSNGPNNAITELMDQVKVVIQVRSTKYFSDALDDLEKRTKEVDDCFLASNTDLSSLSHSGSMAGVLMQSKDVTKKRGTRYLSEAVNDLEKTLVEFNKQSIQ